MQSRFNPQTGTNIPELDLSFNTTFTLTNTVNTSDPIASADQVTIGNFGYTFNVLEGATASVDLMATLDTSLVGTPGIKVNGADFSTTPLDASPTFVIGSISFANPTGGGFVTTAVPEPSTWALLCVGVALICYKRRAARMVEA